MVVINNIPVEIYQVKGARYFYQIARTVNNQYYLYPIYSPVFGFFNFLPFLKVKKEAQRIDPKLAKQYMYVKDKQHSKDIMWFNVGLSMILAQILPNMMTASITNMLTSHIYLEIVMLMVFSILYRVIRVYILRINHKLVASYKPESTIWLKSSEWMASTLLIIFIGTGAGLIHVHDGMGKLTGILLLGLLPVNSTYNIYFDEENVKYTNNRMEIIVDDLLSGGPAYIGNVKNIFITKNVMLDGMHVRLGFMERSIPLTRLVFMDYWSNNKNIGKTVSRKISNNVDLSS